MEYLIGFANLAVLVAIYSKITDIAVKLGQHDTEIQHLKKGIHHGIY